MYSKRMNKSDLVDANNALIEKNDYLQLCNEEQQNEINQLTNQLDDLKYTINLSNDVSYFADCYVLLKDEVDSKLKQKCDEFNALYNKHIRDDQIFIIKFKILLAIFLFITIITSSATIYFISHSNDLNAKVNELNSQYEVQKSLNDSCQSDLSNINKNLSGKTNELNECLLNIKNNNITDNKKQDIVARPNKKRKRI